MASSGIGGLTEDDPVQISEYHALFTFLNWLFPEKDAMIGSGNTYTPSKSSAKETHKNREFEAKV